MTKKEIRNHILSIRKSLTEAEVNRLSNVICNRLSDSMLLKDVLDICFYMPIQNEVDLSGLLPKCRENQIHMWLPRISDGCMDFYQYTEHTPLIEGAYHILEPDNDTKLLPDARTLILTPGSVFSVKGDRIGYGGGYYDRYMKQYPFCKYVAVCYDFQILDDIPCEEHDQKPDVIISEKRIISIS